MFTKSSLYKLCILQISLDQVHHLQVRCYAVSSDRLEIYTFCMERLIFSENLLTLLLYLPAMVGFGISRHSKFLEAGCGWVEWGYQVCNLIIVLYCLVNAFVCRRLCMCISSLWRLCPQTLQGLCLWTTLGDFRSPDLLCPTYLQTLDTPPVIVLFLCRFHMYQKMMNGLIWW